MNSTVKGRAVADNLFHNIVFVMDNGALVYFRLTFARQRVGCTMHMVGHHGCG